MPVFDCRFFNISHQETIRMDLKARSGTAHFPLIIDLAQMFNIHHKAGRSRLGWLSALIE
ncbi:MAG TPA: hypothetical protein VHY08_10910 [Bacillota bacterium]|nr:hypothetical protein [Bacillota bacterium]